MRCWRITRRKILNVKSTAPTKPLPIKGTAHVKVAVPKIDSTADAAATEAIIAALADALVEDYKKHG